MQTTYTTLDGWTDVALSCIIRCGAERYGPLQVRGKSRAGRVHNMISGVVCKAVCTNAARVLTPASDYKTTN